MGLLGRISREHSESVVDHVQFVVDDDLAMGVNDFLVVVTLTGTETGTVTLPPVAEAAGNLYVIRAIDAGGGCTVQDKADDAGLTDITLDSDGESTALYSDGIKWNELMANYS